MRQEPLKLAWVNPAFMAEPSNRADRRRAQREGGATATDGGNAHPPYKTIMITAVISVLLGALVTQFIPSMFGLFRGI